MALSVKRPHAEKEKDIATDTRVTALHKLYHDDGKSFFAAKSLSIYDSGSEGSANLPKEICTVFLDISNGVAYSATIDNLLLNEIKEKSLKKAGSDFEVWVRQTFQESSKNFSFAITPKEQLDDSTNTQATGNYKLIWKKVDGKFKIRLGEIPLSMMDLSLAHAEIFDIALNQIQESAAKVQEIQGREKSLMNDLTEYRNQMIQFRDDKNNLEEQLMAAFLPILHSKQDEIRRLKRKIGELPGYQDDTSEDECLSDNESGLKTSTNPSRPPVKHNKQSTSELTEKMEHKIHHTMSDSDDDETKSFNPDEPKCDSQDFLDMSPTLL